MGCCNTSHTRRRSALANYGLHLFTLFGPRCGWVFVLALIGLLVGCQLPGGGDPAVGVSPVVPAPLPTLMPTPTAQPPSEAPVSNAEPADTGWLAADPGVELRRLRVPVGQQIASVSVVRLDPAVLRFEVGYAPEQPLALSAWAGARGAVAAINGGFFDENNRTVALLVRAGQPVGTSYEGRGGMFAVSPTGALTLRALADTPYDSAEPLAEALQGWPLLVRPGGAAAYSFEDAERARRSALALDSQGRVLLIACPTAAFTLRELSEWLAASDLAIDAALNLDGGSSTALLVQSEQHPERVDAFVPLPIVLLALPR